MAVTVAERKAQQNVRSRTLVMVRRLSATTEAVFGAWTDERQLAKWMGPKTMTVPRAKSDPREGGGYRITMRSPEGKEYTVSGQYCEIRPAERIVMTWSWEEEGGHGPVTCVTIELKPSGKSTEMHFHHALFADKQGRDNHKSGWQGSFDKLAAFCKGKGLN
ncbi:MAG TPA: SRPBCC domain-containing protein [Aestuariivirgaceae bacterium]|jgi:uncharacterized protein YndB with AHSA1/START domain